MEHFLERLNPKATGWVLSPGDWLQARSLQLVCDPDGERFIDHPSILLPEHRRTVYSTVRRFAVG